MYATPREKIRRYMRTTHFIVRGTTGMRTRWPHLAHGRLSTYRDPTTQQPLASYGLNAWYCGPVFDHYRTMKLFVSETFGHRVSGSPDLFPQHCLLPTLNPTQHIEAVHKELRESIVALPKKRRQRLQNTIIKSPTTIEIDLQPPQGVAI